MRVKEGFRSIRNSGSSRVSLFAAVFLLLLWLHLFVGGFSDFRHFQREVEQEERTGGEVR